MRGRNGAASFRRIGCFSSIVVAPPPLCGGELFLSHRSYQTTQRGHDELPPTLWHELGFGSKDNKDDLSMMFRPQSDLRLGLIREAKKLNPEESPKDAAKLETLIDAYTKLSSPGFNKSYAAHHTSSVDARLHVLVEGGEQSANFNPEHQAFDFTAQNNVQRSFGDFKSAYQEASGSPLSSSSETTTAATATKKKTSSRGDDVIFTLRLSFDEAAHGCKKVIEYDRLIRCRTCRGCGEKNDGAPRRCTVCKGLGKVTLPSSTYLLKKECAHCNGAGTQAPPPCSQCRGSGLRKVKEVLPVDVRPGMSNMDVVTMPGRGDDGHRGGPAGNLRLSMVVGEHRLFHRIGDDLHLAHPVSLSTALLGGVVQVPTLRGTTDLRIPPGVSNGQVLFLEKCGVVRDGGANNGGGETAGRLCVHVIVTIPRGESLTGRQRHAMEVMMMDQQPQADKSSASSPPSRGAASSVGGTQQRQHGDATDEAVQDVRRQMIANLMANSIGLQK